MALLSIENVLSEFWKDKNREKLRATASLSSITNFAQVKSPKMFLALGIIFLE